MILVLGILYLAQDLQIATAVIVYMGNLRADLFLFLMLRTSFTRTEAHGSLACTDRM
jgi:hypothetical protein